MLNIALFLVQVLWKRLWTIVDGTNINFCGLNDAAPKARIESTDSLCRLGLEKPICLGPLRRVGETLGACSLHEALRKALPQGR